MLSHDSQLLRTKLNMLMLQLMCNLQLRLPLHTFVHNQQMSLMCCLGMLSAVTIWISNSMTETVDMLFLQIQIQMAMLFADAMFQTW